MKNLLLFKIDLFYSLLNKSLNGAGINDFRELAGFDVATSGRFSGGHRSARTLARSTPSVIRLFSKLDIVAWVK